jgi:hypothetical protein
MAGAIPGTRLRQSSKRNALHDWHNTDVLHENREEVTDP